MMDNGMKEETRVAYEKHIKNDLYKLIETRKGRDEISEFCESMLHKAMAPVDHIRFIEWLLEREITDLDEVANCLIC